jgi:UDP-glucose 4-epimerase
VQFRQKINFLVVEGDIPNNVAFDDKILLTNPSFYMTSYAAHFKDKRILITGGLGFIGSNLASKLVTLGAKVLLVDSLFPQYGGNLFNIAQIKDQVQVNISDVRDEFSMRYLVQGQDYLFNLAGQTSHMDSMQEPHTDLDINCKSQLSILEVCRKYNPEVKIVFASTRQIYGKPDYLPVDEKHILRPVDVNGINKMAGEWYHILYNNVYGIPACALRLTNTYGPRMRVKDARQTFLGIWVKILLSGSAFEVWDGGQLRDFTYVDDAVEVFNLGGESAIGLKDLAEMLVKVNGGGEYKVRTFPSDRKSIDIGDYYADFSLIRSTLGWEPQVPLQEGLARTVAYYREHLEHYL